MAFDAIIVGAGIIGASIAWRLSQSGLRVLLLDAARMGGEASSAGAGMLAPGGEIEQPSPWIDLAIESLRSYPAFIAELEEQTGCQIDFDCLGAVELAPSPREWQALEGRARRQSALGIPSCALARHDLRQYVPLARQDVVGAWFYRPARPDGRVTLRLPGEERVEIREGVRVTAHSPARRYLDRGGLEY
jgi:glycine oxidase